VPTLIQDDDLSFEMTVRDCDTGEELFIDPHTCFAILYEAFESPYQRANGSGILVNSEANISISPFSRS
jgi:hypothetical protein